MIRHDPLINWRLVVGGRRIASETAAEDREGGGERGGYARRPRADEANIHDG